MKLLPGSNVRLFGRMDGSPVVDISTGVNKLAKNLPHGPVGMFSRGCVEAGASVF
jgi:[acyl-carrier-protein] S-malonyltransferase